MSAAHFFSGLFEKLFTMQTHQGSKVREKGNRQVCKRIHLHLKKRYRQRRDKIPSTFKDNEVLF